MPSKHFREWSAYYKIEPFGQWRDNWHSAILATIAANANRNPNSPPIHMSDFMYEDPIEARRRKDAEFLSFIEQKAN
jgi:hypothetical protein